MGMVHLAVTCQSELLERQGRSALEPRDRPPPCLPTNAWASGRAAAAARPDPRRRRSINDQDEGSISLRASRVFGADEHGAGITAAVGKLDRPRRGAASTEVVDGCRPRSPADVSSERSEVDLIVAETSLPGLSRIRIAAPAGRNRAIRIDLRPGLDQTVALVLLIGEQVGHVGGAGIQFDGFVAIFVFEAQPGVGVILIQDEPCSEIIASDAGTVQSEFVACRPGVGRLRNCAPRRDDGESAEGRSNSEISPSRKVKTAASAALFGSGSFVNGSRRTKIGSIFMESRRCAGQTT